MGKEGKKGGTYALLSVDGFWCDAEGEELFGVGTDTAGLEAGRVVKARDDGLLLFGRNLRACTASGMHWRDM